MWQSIYILAFLVPLTLGFAQIDEFLDDRQCGGNVTNKTSISIPSHDANLTCIWRFMLSKIPRYFAVTDFNLRPMDSLLVYDSDYKSGGTTDGNLTGNFTGKLDPFLVVTFSAVSTIIFRSGPKQSNDSNFKIQFNTNDCSLFMNQSSGVVRSPIYSLSPSGHGTLTCSYHIMTPDPKGMVVISFDTVNLSKGNLQVWDGAMSNGSAVVNATGPRTSIGDVVSSKQSLLLKTILSTTKVNNFTATFFTATHACPVGMITLDKPYNLTSPGYPANYANNLDCRFVISATVGTSIAVSVSDVDLGDNVDGITLNDGDTKSDSLLTSLKAGFKQNGLLLTSGNKLWVRIRTDESRSGRGFRILLTPKTYDGASRDHGHFAIQQKMTVFESDTNDTSDIHYLLHAKPGMQVKLTMNNMSVMPTATLEIRDGLAVHSMLIGFFRSDEPYYPVVSSGSSMLLVVRGFLQGGSFVNQQYISAEFSSVKPGMQFSLSGASGSVTLLESAFNGSATYVVVNSNRKKLVALAITELYVPQNASAIVYRGASDQSVKFITYTTGPGENPIKILPVIYTPQARIEYSMVGKLVVEPERILLRFSYRTIQGCDGHELSKESGDVLTSPQYPNLYPANAHCSWTFTPVQNKHLRLSFSDIFLAANHSLKIEADHYKIWTVGNKTIHNMTSQTLDVLTHDVTNLPDVLVMMNNNSLNSTKVKVTFNANFTGKGSDLDVSSGFKVSYEHLMCGGNITNSSQPISTPGFPSPLTGQRVRCVWVINLPHRPATSNSSVNIVKFNLNIEHYKNTTNTSMSIMEVRDGGSARAPLFPIPMKDGKTDDILSRRNKVWILYSFNGTDKDKSQGPSMKVTFSVYVCAKADQCSNGICMHSDWKCNGKDECGDDSDERDCFHATNTVSRVVLGMSIFLTFILATAIACIVPTLYKRFKYPNYSELRDLMTPVPT